MSARSKRTTQAIMVGPWRDIGDSIAIGPGKIDLLRQVAATCSISAAARGTGYELQARLAADPNSIFVVHRGSPSRRPVQDEPA